PPEQRAVLVLRHVDGLREDEMAAALGVAPGTVKSRLHRARAAFRARWGT
ncbi:MAG TPA: sigma-70 region 4 domain-containing protein, partial [Acidimicrobiales bacterium]